MTKIHIQTQLITIVRLTQPNKRRLLPLLLTQPTFTYKQVQPRSAKIKHNTAHCLTKKYQLQVKYNTGNTVTTGIMDQTFEARDMSKHAFSRSEFGRAARASFHAEVSIDPRCAGARRSVCNSVRTLAHSSDPLIEVYRSGI